MDNFSEYLGYVIFEYGAHRVTVFNVLMAILILAVVRLITWSLKKYLSREKSKIDYGRRYALYKIIKYVLYTLGALLAITSLGVNMSIILAGSAALFVGLGFGLQNTFNDFISGVILLFEGTVEVGDIVEVDGLMGRVTRIDLRSTVVDTLDAISIIVPNSKFTSENVTNWSHNNKMTRFNIKVGVAYGSDVPLVKKVLQECAVSQSEVERRPAPQVLFTGFGDHSLNFELMFWSYNPFEVQNIASKIRFAIEAAFREHQIVIPFPQLDMHVKHLPKKDQ